MATAKTPAQTVTIDNQEYPIDSLSDAAKQQLMNLRVVDQEITRLKTQLGIANIARAVCANGVKNNLPPVESLSTVTKQ